VGGVIQRVENYLMDCIRSASRALRTFALPALTVAGLLALAVGALVAFVQIAGLFMLAAWMGTESLKLPAFVLVLFIYTFWRYWRWWRPAKRQGGLGGDR
jgi:ABC-type dipeptide/oligopeptide/nickel transport system permease component